MDQLARLEESRSDLHPLQWLHDLVPPAGALAPTLRSIPLESWISLLAPRAQQEDPMLGAIRLLSLRRSPFHLLFLLPPRTSSLKS